MHLNSVKEREDVLGVPITLSSEKKIKEDLTIVLENPFSKTVFLFTPNTEMVMNTKRDDELKKILQESDYTIPDGIGIVWAIKKIYKKKIKRITGVDFIQEVCGIAAKTEQSVFFLGAKEGVGKKCSQVLLKQYPQLRISGAYSGRSSDSFSDFPQKVQEQLKKTDILFVAFGSPRQEKWISTNKKEFPSLKIAMGVGGSFDFISGDIPRAPHFMRKLGVEWLFRLWMQPWRIKRMISLPLFVLQIMYSN